MSAIKWSKYIFFTVWIITQVQGEYNEIFDNFMHGICKYMFTLVSNNIQFFR